MLSANPIKSEIESPEADLGYSRFYRSQSMQSVFAPKF